MSCKRLDLVFDLWEFFFFIFAFISLRFGPNLLRSNLLSYNHVSPSRSVLFTTVPFDSHLFYSRSLCSVLMVK